MQRSLSFILFLAMPSVSIAQEHAGHGTPGTSRVHLKGHPVAVWLTTNDHKATLQRQRDVALTSSASGDNPIYVDETQVYQQVEGFGAAMTDSAAYLLNRVAAPSQVPAVMSNLFTREGGGIALNFLRNPMGSSDIARGVYSFDDMPAGQADADLTNFSIAHDQADILPLIKQARLLNPQLKIMANPWSPPGWMKSSGSMIGGTLLPSMYTPFAKYFVKYLQAYSGAGVDVDYISLQNEPLYVPGDYPGMGMDAPTQATVLRDYVLPALSANHLTARVLVYDHNWDSPGYPDTVLSDPTILNSPQVAGIAWHGYGGPAGSMWTLNAKYPQKGNWETELSGGTWVSNQLQADFENIIHAMRNWAKSWVKWSLVLDQNLGPHAGGCGTCTPIVTVNSTTGEATYTIEYYTLGHFSKFLHPNARRVYSSNGPGILTAAFANPDNSKVLVAFNDTTDSRTFQVRWGSEQFAYTLPGLGAATFTWSGVQQGSYAIPATTQMQASSFNNNAGLQTEGSTDTLGGYDVGYAAGGSYALYKSIDFGVGVSSVRTRVASAGSGGTLEFRLDSPNGPAVGTVTIPITGGWQTWTTVSGPVAGAVGLHDLYMVYKGGSSIGNVNWFQFQ